MPSYPLPRNPYTILHNHTHQQQQRSHSVARSQVNLDPAIRPSQAKKRRTDRACDACRRKKTRCDGPWTISNICTNCLQTRKPCTYLEASKPRGPPKAYVTGLEDRVEDLENLLAQIRPHTDFSEELGPPVIRDSWKNVDESARAHHRTKSSSPSQSTSHYPVLSNPTSATVLPPIMIPLHSSSGIIGPSTIVRTTHLMFNSSNISELKKRSSRTGSEVTVSSSSASGSGSTRTTTAPGGYRSSPSYTWTSTSSDSECSRHGGDDDDDSDVEELVESSIGGRTRIMLKANDTLQLEDNLILFHGRSSTAGLVETTRRFKHMHMEETTKMEVEKRERYEEGKKHEAVGESEGERKLKAKAKELKIKIGGPDNITVALTRRPEFWRTPAWELSYEGQHSSSPPNSMIPHVLSHFPPEDLAQNLIQLYFIYSNDHFPLLHRPTFERQWRERLYEKNIWFTCLCMMIFAVGSRWSDDERVLTGLKGENFMGGEDTQAAGEQAGEVKGDPQATVLDCQQDWEGTVKMDERDDGAQGKKESCSNDGLKEEKELDWSFAGAKYFEVGFEVHRLKRSLFYPATLFEIQTFTLMGTYLRGSQAYPASYLIVAIGLRKAQDVGAHRRKLYRGTPNADDELWKRAFWHLVVFDRIGSVALGRAGGISEEDFDIDFPIEVDDEYWEGKDAWKQPEGRPSVISAFNHFIKLTQIIAFTLRTLYAINKSKVFRGLIEGDWRGEVVAQLNTSMDEWLQELPEHLKWSEDLTNTTFSSQASTLYTTYHLTRLLVYRPFIHTFNNTTSEHPEYAPPPAPFPYPALAICIASSRACARIVDAQVRRGSWEGVHVPNMIQAAFVSAGLLILALWDLKSQEKVLKRARSAGIIALSGNNDSEMEKVKTEAGCDGMSRSSVDAEDAKPDAVALLLKHKMDELKGDIQTTMNALEWVKPRWGVVKPFLENLRESFPGEDLLSIPSPDVRALNDDEEIAKKKENFQDLRRQKQQLSKHRQQLPAQIDFENDFGLTTKSSNRSLRQQQIPGTSANTASEQIIHHRASHPSLPALASAARSHDNSPSCHLSAPFTFHQTHQYHNPPDPAQFIKQHLPGMHTLVDDDFDDFNDRVIKLPQINYKVSPTHPPTIPALGIELGSKGNATWSNSDTSPSISPPLSYPSSNVSPHTSLATHSHSHQAHSPSNHQRIHSYANPYPFSSSDNPRPRTHSLTAAAAHVDQSTPLINNSMRCTSMSNLPLSRQTQNEPLRIQLHDVSAVRRGGHISENLATVYSQGATFSVSGSRISPSESVSSLGDTRGTSRIARGGHMVTCDDINIHYPYHIDGEMQTQNPEHDEVRYSVSISRTESLDHYSDIAQARVEYDKSGMRLDRRTSKLRRREAPRIMNEYIDSGGQPSSTINEWNPTSSDHPHAYHSQRASLSTQRQSFQNTQQSRLSPSHPPDTYHTHNSAIHQVVPDPEAQVYFSKNEVLHNQNSGAYIR